MLGFLSPSEGWAAFPGVCGAEPSSPHPTERTQHQGKEKPGKNPGRHIPEQGSFPRIKDLLRPEPGPAEALVCPSCL